MGKNTQPPSIIDWGTPGPASGGHSGMSHGSSCLLAQPPLPKTLCIWPSLIMLSTDSSPHMVLSPSHMTYYQAGDAGDADSTPGSGSFPGGGNGNPLQYSCLENPMDRGAWRATVHGVAKSRTWLKDWAHIHLPPEQQIFCKEVLLFILPEQHMRHLQPCPPSPLPAHLRVGRTLPVQHRHLSWVLSSISAPQAHQAVPPHPPTRPDLQSAFWFLLSLSSQHLLKPHSAIKTSEEQLFSILHPHA